MKKLLNVTLLTSMLTVTTITPVFASTTVLGEENSGKEYEVQQIEELNEHAGEEIEIHLLPKKEKVRFDDIESGVPNTYVVATFYYYQEPSDDPHWNAGGGWFGTIEDYWLCEYEADKEYNLYKIIKESLDNTNMNAETKKDHLDNNIWGVFVHSFNTEEDFSYDQKDLDVYYFKFVNTPVLTPDEEDPEYPNGEDKKDEPASNSEASSNSGSHSSSHSSSKGSRGGSSKRDNVDNPLNVTGTWVQDATGWWFKKTDGSYPVNEWIMVKNKWYRFNETGYMVTGWIELEGKKYFLNNDGAMQTGWLEINGKWFFFDRNGVMLFNVTLPGGYKLNESGEWIE